MGLITKKILAYSLSGPGIQPGADPVSSVERILSNLIAFLTVVAVIFFVVQIILAGFSFISSNGDPKLIDTSKKKLTFSIIGLVIVVLAYALTALLSKLLGLGNIFDLSRLFI